MPVANVLVERLIALGRPTGRLDPADLAAAVPLDRLSVLDLAELIDRLEEAGISVEIDPRLLVARAPSAPAAEGTPPPPDATATRVGVFPRPTAGAATTVGHGAADAAAAHGAQGHGATGHGVAREVSPTVLAIGSMIVAVVLILLVVGGGQAGG